MNINRKKIIAARKARAWTQQHLADASALSLRTIQRVENNGSGSLETIKSLASCFELDVKTLFESESVLLKHTDKPKTKLAILVSFIITMLSSALFVAPTSIASNIKVSAKEITTDVQEGYSVFTNEVEIYLPKPINYEVLIGSDWQSNSSVLSGSSVKIYLPYSVVLIENATITKTKEGTKITTNLAKFSHKDLS